MANDDRINVRVSVMEYRMDMLVESVEEIRANYVSKAYLNEVVSHLATKEDLKLYATKEDLKAYASKEDLRQVEQNIRNWIIGLFFTLFFSLSAMQFAMFQLYRHTS